MVDPEINTLPGEEPLFNIGIVARMTDIMESTLRVWERRYQFPSAVRSSGGQRLYSQQEIMRLKWVKQRVDEGMRVSKAIHALRHTHNKEHAVNAPPVRAVQQTLPIASLPVLQYRLVQRLINHDMVGANALINAALTHYALEEIILQVISPTLFAIGEAWHEGGIDIATEHLATNLVRHNLLAWLHSSPPPFQVAPVLLACAPGELHEGSLLMLAVLLQRLRWPTIYLGQSMPLEDFAPFVRELKPSIIVFVAMTEDTAHALMDWPRHLPDAARSGHPLVGYGGKGFVDHPELVGQVPGISLGSTLSEGLETLNRLLHQLNPVLR